VNGVEKCDFIIVGSGLAGCVLALQLTQVGKKVLLIGNDQNISSRVAAGLFNPVTGKVLSKTWLADEVFKAVHTFYPAAEKLTGQHFFHSMPIYRPFLTIEEQNEWMGKSASPEWMPFIKKVFTTPAGWPGVNDPLGGLLLQQTGFVDTIAFMRATKDFFLGTHQFMSETFDYTGLTIRESEVTYKHVVSTNIVFCEGVNANQNPHFKWLPVRPLKGETLTVKAALPAEAIVNRGVYAVPTNEGHFKIGATYETQHLHPGITNKGRHELEGGFMSIFTQPFTVTSQEWGLRPTTPDRRPLMGEHPVHKNVFVLNGLGTKGVSLAPFAGGLLTNFFMTGTKSPAYAAVDLNRYYSLYWKAVQTP
jgi:glycine oxidase